MVGFRSVGWSGIGAALAAAALAGVAWAQDFQQFDGAWQGASVDADTPFAISARVLNLKFDAGRDEFDAKWRAYLFVGEETEPDLMEADVTYVASERPGVFADDDEGDPLNTEALSWAHVQDGVLTIGLLRIDADTGRYQARLARWTWGEDGLSVTVSNLNEGMPLVVFGGLAARE